MEFTMPLFKVEAINLKSAPFAETDKLLTVFSREKGKFNVIAKGARRPTSKFGGRCEVLAYNALLVAEGRSLNILSQAETIQTFQKIRDDFEAFNVAARMVRIVNVFLEDFSANAPLFAVLLGGLNLLEARVTPALALAVFAAKFAKVEGFAPVIDRCAHCGRRLRQKPQKISFSAAAGGIVCEKCTAKVYGPQTVSYAVLELAGELAEGDFSGFKELHNLTDNLAGLNDWLISYLSAHLGREV
jgi:DNA repair protein RecO (recombination protein O)